MPPQPSNQPFKQRKNLGKGFCFPGKPLKRGEVFRWSCCSSSAATRKQEVAGIRSKFPNKIPVSARPQRGLGTGRPDPGPASLTRGPAALTRFCRLQVIIERYDREKYLPPLDKTKFLVPHELTMTQFVTIIR